MLKKIFPNHKKLLKLAELCTVVDQETGKAVPFNLLDEQKEILREMCESRMCIFLKGRQIGCSTVICFLDAVYAVVNPGTKIAVVADTEQKVHGLLDRVRDFIVGLGLHMEISNRAKIRLANGSEIHALTANASKGQEQSKAGRSMSYQMLHLSEIAFWPDQDAFGALTASAGMSAPIIIESTSSGPGDLFWQLWSHTNNFKKVFFSVESHTAYRDDPKLLTEDQIIRGEELGFETREGMAWFFRALEDRFSGDLIKCLREYPQKPEHAFQSAEGRWIAMTSPILRHTPYDLDIKIFQERQNNHFYSVGVDTSGGIGKDASTIAVLDKNTGSLVCTYYDNESTIDELAEKVRKVYELYAPDHVCIETNGIGQATSQACRDKGVPVLEFKTTEASRYTALLLTKLAVERTALGGPEELALECADLHIDRNEKFAGKKDLCMAIGFALEDAKRNPVMVVREKTTNVFDMTRHLSSAKVGWKGF